MEVQTVARTNQIPLAMHTAVRVAERATWVHATDCKKAPEPAAAEERFQNASEDNGSRAATEVDEGDWGTQTWPNHFFWATDIIECRRITAFPATMKTWVHIQQPAEIQKDDQPVFEGSWMNNDKSKTDNRTFQMPRKASWKVLQWFFWTFIAALIVIVYISEILFCCLCKIHWVKIWKFMATEINCTLKKLPGTCVNPHPPHPYILKWQ